MLVIVMSHPLVPRLLAMLALSPLVPRSTVAAPDLPPAPVARAVPYETRLHGDTLSDPYRWLREKTSPETIAYLEAENRYSDAALQPTADLRARLYAEMVGRIKETDQTAPYPLHGFLYSTRTEQGRQYGILCRQRAGAPGTVAPEEVTLDLNALAAGKKFLGLGVYEVSEDANLLAFSTDETGFRQYTLQVKDLRTGQPLPDRIERVDFAQWSADGKSLFYIVEDDAKRAYRLLRHVLGRDVAEDELLFEEKDELYRLEAGASSDRSTLLVLSASSTTTEARALRRDAPPGTAPRLLLPREEGHEYYPDLYAGRWFFRTNKDAKNFRLVSAPLDDPRPERWQEFLPHRPAVKLDNFRFFARHAVVEARENGLPCLELVDPAAKVAQPRRVPMPEPAFELSEDQNHEFDTNKFRFVYQSLTTPKSVFELDLDTGERRLLKRQEVPGGYDPADYVSERLEVIATDGARVPVSLVYKRGTPRDGSAPCLLYGYGSYGIPMPVSFSSNRLSLLDRGVVYAIAHVRGGGELGEPWHDAGKMMFKRNTFTDFINCAETLVRERYTSTSRLAIQGGSAGGLLMGAVTNMRPELFRAVVMQVPFVDVMNTMLDASLPLTVGEYLEWGNPNEKPAFEYMRSYSPYDNLQARDYPAILAMTSLNDSQVMYWEPAKYVAKLRTLKTDHNPLLLHTNMDAGHGGASGRYDALKEVSLAYGFVLEQLGVERVGPTAAQP